jgi:hypothetical protein
MAQTDPTPTVTIPARSDHSSRPDGSTKPVAPSPSTEPGTDRPAHQPTEGQLAVEVIAARVLTVASVAMVMIALYGFTLLDRSDGNSVAVVVSGAFGISAAVIGLVVGFINAHRAT